MSVHAPAAPTSSPFGLSLCGSIRPYRREWLSQDVVAGITLAALAIPEVMGDTRIAGTPVITDRIGREHVYPAVEAARDPFESDGGAS